MLRLGDILYPMANLDQVNPNQMDLDQLTNLDEANLDEVNLDQLTNLQHQAPIIRGLYLIFAQPVVSCPDLLWLSE